MTNRNYPGFTWDAIERVGWTLIQVAAGAALDYMLSGEVTWRGALYAVGIAVLKVIAARSIGGPTARAIPGHSDEVVGK